MGRRAQLETSVVEATEASKSETRRVVEEAAQMTRRDRRQPWERLVAQRRRIAPWTTHVPKRTED